MSVTYLYRAGLLAIAILLVFAALPAVAIAGDRITRADSLPGAEDIDGRYVVWQDYVGVIPDIYLYDRDTQTTTDIWPDGPGVFYAPSVHNGEVAVGRWDTEHYPGNVYSLLLYSIATNTTTVLATTSNVILNTDLYVSVSGDILHRTVTRKVVWEEKNESTGLSEVWYIPKFGNTPPGQPTIGPTVSSGTIPPIQPQRLSSTLNATRPRIDGDHVVWTAESGTGSRNRDVFCHTISTGTETRLTTTPEDESGAAISGDRVVWSVNDGTGSRVRGCTLGSAAFEIAGPTAGGGAYAYTSPAIDGDNVVFVLADHQIGTYDWSTGKRTRLTEPPTRVTTWDSPAVSDGMIVWCDDRVDPEAQRGLYLGYVTDNIVRPYPVTDLHIAAKGTTWIRLEWTDRVTDPGFGAYDHIQVSTVLGCTYGMTDRSPVPVALGVQSYNATGLNPGAEYLFYVTPVTTSGILGEGSEIATLTEREPSYPNYLPLCHGVTVGDRVMDMATNTSGILFAAGLDTSVSILRSDYLGSLSYVGDLRNDPPGSWRSVAVGPDDTVFVTGFGDVRKLSPSGQTLAEWPVHGSLYSLAIAVAGDGTSYVTVYDKLNPESAGIQKFAPNGTFLLEWGSWGNGTGQFKPEYPGIGGLDIAVDASGNVYVADTGNCRVQKFDPNGTFLLAWGTAGYGDTAFIEPMGIAVDSAGAVFVTDRYAHRIKKFDSTGAFLGAWSLQQGSLGQINHLESPHAVTVAANGAVFVSEDNDVDIYCFTINGVPIYPTPTTVATQPPAVGAVPPSTLPPTDTTADGIYDDVNGNGRRDFNDIVLYFNQMAWIAANEPVAFFDCNANGRIDFSDVVWLFNHL